MPRARMEKSKRERACTGREPGRAVATRPEQVGSRPGARSASSPDRAGRPCGPAGASRGQGRDARVAGDLSRGSRALTPSPDEAVSPAWSRPRPPHTAPPASVGLWAPLSPPGQGSHYCPLRLWRGPVPSPQRRAGVITTARACLLVPPGTALCPPPGSVGPQ